MHFSPGTVRPSTSPVRPIEEYSAPFFLPPSQDEAGLAVIPILKYGLHESLHSFSGSCGFDYTPQLLMYGIKKEDWQQFTSTIIRETKSSRRQLISVDGEGLGRLAVGGVIVGISSAVPMFFAASRARFKQDMLDFIASSTCCRIENLSRHISSWNDCFFRLRGIKIRLDLFDGDWDEDESTASSKTSSTWQTSGVKSPPNSVARIVIVLLKTWYTIEVAVTLPLRRLTPRPVNKCKISAWNMAHKESIWAQRLLFDSPCGFSGIVERSLSPAEPGPVWFLSNLPQYPPNDLVTC